MDPAADREIDPRIEILDGTDVADVWGRFEVFEALHHNMQICNPMSSTHLDEVIEAIGLTNDSRVLDVACGYGEVLFRAAAKAKIVGTGIDLSPWMITSAQRLVAERAPQADLHWVLGEARDFTIEPGPDVAVCIGAEWVWHDFGGTARALAERLTNGGVAVIGAARLHERADQAAVRVERGHVETIDDLNGLLVEHGFTVEHRIDPTDDDWDRYLGQTKTAVESWASSHPGESSDRWREEQADWQRARDQDRDVIGWSVWVARRCGN